jgi:uncharacterized protein YndB with AHSA1/START domain
MPSIRTAVVIDCPIESVFDFLATASNCAHWQGSSCTGAIDRVLQDGEEIVEKTNWADRQLTFHWIVKTCNRPGSLILQGRSDPSGNAVVTYSLTPNPKGTRVSREFRYDIPILLDSHGGFFGLRDRLHAESAQALRRLKRLLETDAIVCI